MAITTINEINTIEQNNSFSSEESFRKKLGLEHMPFQSKLSFEPYIRHIEENSKSTCPAQSTFAQQTLVLLKGAPELRNPIVDETILERYKETVALLLMGILPPALQQNQLAKVIAPFKMVPIYETPGLRALFQDNEVIYSFSKASDIVNCAMIVNACGFILNQFYNQQINIDPPISLTITNPKTKLKKHYKTQLNYQFVDIVKKKPLRPISQEEINHLLSNIYDIDLWMEYLPPENFEFQGLVIGSLIDITEEVALSQLRYSLLEKDAVVDAHKIQDLQNQMRTYFAIPKLHMGITAIDYPIENSVNHKYKIRFDFLAQEQEVLLAPENANSIYEKACKYKEVLLIEDLKQVSDKTPIETGLVKKGIRSILVAPLLNSNDQVIGLLEIGSPKPFDLHSFTELKFKELISLFSTAVERSREEIDNRVEAIIREQYTAVHPSVEWKFVETSYNLLEKRQQNIPNATVDPIIFEDVYPLYGQADIVSSSVKRNKAIQADLIENLQRAAKLINYILENIRYPLLNQSLMKIERGIQELNKEFNSNDESRIVELLQTEIHPLLKQVQVEYSNLAIPISTYFEKLDSNLGIIYHQRKDYENSVSMVNNMIANYLEEQEKISQKALPHYFERYKTDGVEYDMYVGQSLLKRGKFSNFHLKNLRLWQLIDMCNITRRIEELQDQLPVPLTTAQLVFAYTNPLSIRFRMDEKQFDVDGAYNVRYEILKKRIDKAVIEGTKERLTQAGKIAIVYLQEKDKFEYLEYIDYLKYEGYITDEVEDVQLGKLQGVQGLRALRVTVKN